MRGRISNKLGDVNISEDVIATYAGSVAVECFGVVGMAVINMKDGLAWLLNKDTLNRGVSVTIKDNEVSLSMHIIVAYGVSISAVADNLIENVRYKVEEFTGMKVGSGYGLAGIGVGNDHAAEAALEVHEVGGEAERRHDLR